MDKCPSCNEPRDQSAKVCGHCGHLFEDESKHTMMGFPGLKAALAAEEPEEQDPNKQTLFGFPAQKFGAPGAAQESEASEVEEDDGATEILMNPRGTIAGFSITGEPATPAPEPAPEPDSRATSFGLPSIEVQKDPPPAVEDDPDDASPRFGTMVGMNVADIVSQLDAESGDDDSEPAKTTQFAMPAFNPNAAEELDEESEGDEDDASTVAWNPLTDAPITTSDSPEKKAVLEKLREEKPNPLRETGARPLPSLAGPKKLPKPGGLGSKLGLTVPKPKGLVPERNQKETPLEFPEDDIATTIEQKSDIAEADAATGVLKRAGAKRRPAQVSETGPVLGAYVVNKSELTTDNLNEVSEVDEDDEAPTEMVKAPSFLDQPSQSISTDTEAEDEDLALAETGIVPGNIADRIVTESVPKPATPSTTPKLDPWASSNDGLSIQDQVAATQEGDRPILPIDSAPTAPEPQQTFQPTQAPVATRPDAPMQTFPQSQADAPLQVQQQPNRQPVSTSAPTMNPSDEKLVSRIQMVFGGLATFITLLVVVGAALGYSGGIIGWLPIAVCGLLAALMGVGTIAPVSTGTKSILFGVAAGVVMCMGILGSVVGVPYVVAFVFAAGVSMLAALFPVIGRKVL